MAQINLRVDDNLKSSAERTLNDIGLSMSTAINIFLKTVVGKTVFHLNCQQTLFTARRTWKNWKDV